MVPITRRATSPNQKNVVLMLINNEPILIRSMQAAGIAQDTFTGKAGESEGGEEETTGGYFYCYFYRSG